MSLKLSVALVSGFLALVMVPAAISHGYSHAICQCHLVEQKPVCGSDGRTYSNTCEAACNYASVQCLGTCPCSQPANCICPLNFDPVCGSDGVTYGNQCQANCANIRVVCKGSCDVCLKSPYPTNPGGIQPRPGDAAGQPANCICPLNFDPVCGSDGVTYGNQCQANCANKRVVCKGSCDACLENPYPTYPGGIQPRPGDAAAQPANCACPLNFDPVCGSDGVTYGNQCQADCAGKRVVCKGSCTSCLSPYSAYPGGIQPRPQNVAGQNPASLEMETCSCQSQGAYGRPCPCKARGQPCRCRHNAKLRYRFRPRY